MRWLIFFFPISLFAQSAKEVTLHISPIWGKGDLILNHYYTFDTAKVVFESLRFYVSCEEKSETSKKKNNSPVFHLVDLENEKSKKITVRTPTKTALLKLQIGIGVDSATHEKVLLTGDLDPTKGMYWTWQTGYINLKVEGKINNVPFQYHLGGYILPNKTFQSYSFDVNKKSEFLFTIDFKKWLEKATSLGRSHIMSPGENATTLANYIEKCIDLK